MWFCTNSRRSRSSWIQMTGLRRGVPRGSGALNAENTGSDPVVKPGNTASASLMGRDVAGGDLVLVRGEGCENFIFFALRNLDVVQGPPELCRDLVEFCRGDFQIAMSFLK